MEDFADLDLNGCGAGGTIHEEMTPSFAKALLHAPNLLNQLCTLYFQEYDHNGNSQLDLAEVEELTLELRQKLGARKPVKDELRTSVQLCSKTHADYLSQEELAAWFTAELRADLAMEASTFRTPCKYGLSCYRNAAHKAKFSHPGDDDYVAPHPGEDLLAPPEEVVQVCKVKQPAVSKSIRVPQPGDEDYVAPRPSSKTSPLIEDVDEVALRLGANRVPQPGDDDYVAPRPSSKTSPLIEDVELEDSVAAMLCSARVPQPGDEDYVAPRPSSKTSPLIEDIVVQLEDSVAPRVPQPGDEDYVAPRPSSKEAPRIEDVEENVTARPGANRVPQPGDDDYVAPRPSSKTTPMIEEDEVAPKLGSARVPQPGDDDYVAPRPGGSI